MDQHALRVSHGGLGQVGELTGDALHAVFDLITASWLREGSFAAIPCARFPAAQERSRSRVRTAPPALWIRCPAVLIRRTTLASRPESVG